MNKKAEGLPLNMIIIALIALVVLVVIIAIFTGAMGDFFNKFKKSNTCESLGGKCQTNECASGKIIYGASNCNQDYDNDGKIDNEGESHCCKP